MRGDHHLPARRTGRHQLRHDLEQHRRAMACGGLQRGPRWPSTQSGG
jgi:hypothetical protein